MPPIVFALTVATLPLAVRVYDTSGVSDDIMLRARATVEQTLTAVGIRPVWRACHANACIDPPARGEIVVRIVNATGRSPRGLLGTSMVDVSDGSGTLATIYRDRVQWLAGDAHVDDGRLLGYAISHEIGHLLLGTTVHGQSGLMRAQWLAAELRRQHSTDWTFSSMEGSGMRGRLIARAGLATVR